MKITKKDLLDAGCHFGHLTRKWDPRMAPYIFTEKSGIHLIDLNKTLTNLEQACTVVRSMAAHNKKIMFVATKKQAKDVVVEQAKRLNMPYVTERWLGGMLTNFLTIKKSLKKMSSIEKLMKDISFANLAKRERLMKQREKEKLERILGGIADMSRVPHALFVVDIKREHIAVKEAQKLNIPIFAIVDTNSDPNQVDYVIPANDDAFKSVATIVTAISGAIEEGLQDRKRIKEEEREKAAAKEKEEKALAEEKREAAEKDAKADETKQVAKAVEDKKTTAKKDGQTAEEKLAAKAPAKDVKAEKSAAEKGEDKDKKPARKRIVKAKSADSAKETKKKSAEKTDSTTDKKTAEKKTDSTTDTTSAKKDTK